MSTAHEIALNCLILGDDFSQGFVARIPEASLVADLKKSIKQEKENAFSDVDANDLRLLKVSLPTGHWTTQTEFVSGFRSTPRSFRSCVGSIRRWSPSKNNPHPCQDTW